MQKKAKTLLVEYAPRGKDSLTKMIREYYTNQIKDKTEIEVLDIAKNPPDMLTEDRLRAYYKRNYLNKKLSPEEAKLLIRMDEMRDQLFANEYLIISSPMYNFGYPAPVKAWIDSVMQRGYVYHVDDNGHKPSLDHLKVCVIYTSGIVFDQINENQSWNGLVSEGAMLFEYMGAKEVRIVHVQGSDMLGDENINFRINNVAYKKLNWIASKWY